ncbi:MAG TPA: hypothetical protein DCP91_09420 [Eggerthellaceae bacterium]|nr:hypothetical protein [Eggerthellaceae bacterium]
MTKVVVTEEYLADTGDAIREKNGGTATYTPAQFGPAIRAIDTSGNTGSKTISANGTYSASSDNLDGYDEVTVNVPNTYASGDEGKVVSSGALVAQTTRNVSANGTYDTTTNDSTVVNVQPNVGSKSIVANGSYSASADSLDGYSDVSVNVPNSYAASDEGKVVSSGALVAQSGLSVSANGTYDTTLNDEVIVNVSGGGGSTLGTKSITANGTYDAADDSLDGYSQVTVSVPTSGGGMAGLVERSLSEVYDAQASYVEMYAFMSYSGLMKVELPNVLAVHSGAFSSCSSLASVSLPLCEQVLDNAFYGCRSLSDVYMPNVLAVHSGAFYSCSSLASVSFPLCEQVSSGAFYGCRSLSDVYMPNCEFIGSSAFVNCYSLTSAVFPRCSAVPYNAFANCSSLQEAVFPICESVADKAFAFCSYLSSLSFPACTFISSGAFRDCERLISVYFPVCNTIRSWAFSNCSRMTTASFPSCAKINEYAFCECIALTSLYLLGSSVTTLGSSTAFSYTPMSQSSYTGAFGSVFVPESLAESYRTASGWSLFSARIVGLTDAEIAAL